MAYRFDDFEAMYKKEIGADYPDWEDKLRESHRQVEKVVRRIMRDHPFYAALASEMHIRFHPSIGTAATDGETIAFAPEFWMNELDRESRLFVMLHEIDHNANLHTVRFHEQQLHPKLWNIACDYAINSNMKHLNKMPLPNDALHNDHYKGWGAEQIYKDIYEEAERNKDQGTGQSTIDTRTGESGKYSKQHIDMNEDYQSHQEAKDQSQASGQGGDEGADASPANGQGSQGNPGDKMRNDVVGMPGCGTDPGELRRIQNKMKKLVDVSMLSTAKAYEEQGKEVPFKRTGGPADGAQLDLPTRVKNAMLTYAAKDDYTFRRPHKRYLPFGHYLPTMFSTKSSEIIFAIDNSGSIDEKQLTEAGSAITAMMQELNIETLRILHCDTSVNLVEKVSKWDLPYEVTSRAGGGTSFDPVFQTIEENGWEPDILIYFTDLEGRCSYGKNENSPYFKPPPPYPTIWLYSKNRSQGPAPGINHPVGADEFIQILKDNQQYGRRRNRNMDYLKGYLPKFGTFLSMDD